MNDYSGLALNILLLLAIIFGSILLLNFLFKRAGFPKNALDDSFTSLFQASPLSFLLLSFFCILGLEVVSHDLLYATFPPPGPIKPVGYMRPFIFSAFAYFVTKRALSKRNSERK